jgi:hypothetical protein
VNFPALERFITPLILAQFTRLSLILNPLFPTDGYWLLADLTRSVNLGQTASENLKKLKPNLYSLYALLALGFSAFSAIGLGWYLVNLLSGLWSRLGL